ncbi:MAG: MGH1-like glycoside hydrolase domain-containing protein [Candidatus Bathyarchaeia archaeon]
MSKDQQPTQPKNFLTSQLLEFKRREAVNTIRSCLGPEGVYASGTPSTYNYEYWTRDLCYSYEALINLGLEAYVKRHVEMVVGSRRGGQVPTLILKYSRIFSSPIKYTDQVDNELLILEVLRKMGRLDLYREIWSYIESKIGRGGFIYGRDWRDGMKIYIDKATFNNQVLMYRVCPDELKDKLRDQIEATFWLPERGHYADYVSREGLKSEHLDVLGHASAILCGLIPKVKVNLVMSNLNRALTSHGYTNIYPRYSRGACGLWNLIPGNLYQNGGVWVFVHGHMVLALLHLGLIDDAMEQFMRMCRWRGFNEWYDPQTGEPKGSRNQLWTAALWLRCYTAIKDIVD